MRCASWPASADGSAWTIERPGAGPSWPPRPAAWPQPPGRLGTRRGSPWGVRGSTGKGGGVAEGRDLPAAARPGRPRPAGRTLAPGPRRRRQRGVREAFLALLDRPDDLLGDAVGAGTGTQEELEQDALFELLDRLHDHPALVAPDGPGGGDAPRRQHVHAQRDVADPPLPDVPADLLFPA